MCVTDILYMIISCHIYDRQVPLYAVVKLTALFSIGNPSAAGQQ